MSDINLLRNRRNSLEKKEKTLLIVRVVAVGLVIITATLAIVLFFLNTDPTLTTVKNQEAALTQSLVANKDIITKQLFLVDRLQHIQTTLPKRNAFEGNIITMQHILPNDVTIDTLTFSKGEMTISVVSVSLSSINSLLDSLATKVASKQFLKSMTVDGVVADSKTGKYFLSIHAILL